MRRRQQPVDPMTATATVPGSTYPNPVEASTAEDQEELSPLMIPFNVSKDKKKKSVSILPRNFNGRRRLILAASSFMFALFLVQFWSHGKSSSLRMNRDRREFHISPLQKMTASKRSDRPVPVMDDG
jgi:hypothetical protein